MSATPGSKRLVSLDAFRGLTILGMLVVNNIALDTATPRLLTHAPWNQGVTLADLVFPWFLLIVGVALPYSFASSAGKGISFGSYIFKALSRALALVFLGCLIDSSLAKRPVFDLGVLQLIGLAFLTAALFVKLSPLTRFIVAGIFLISHWILVRFFPIPGMEAGIFTESQNFINYLNQTYLLDYHLKGIISVAPTSAMVLIGSVIGDILRKETFSPLKKVGLLIGSGLILSLLGWLWNLDLPFNKTVWSASYILYTAGLGLLVLSLFYALLDIKLWRFWAFPLLVFGTNAIIAYVLPILVKIHCFQEWLWKMPDGTTLPLQQAWLNFCITQSDKYWGGWTYTCSYILFWWLILLILYRKKIFLKI
jgi:predicted acyltransferase